MRQEGRPRMSLEQRAKIFVPFDPLDGFRAALAAKEREVEKRALDERAGLDPELDDVAAWKSSQVGGMPATPVRHR